VTKNVKGDIWEFEAPSPVPSAWSESQTIHGRVLGPADARSALLVLHGAYGEYIPCQMQGRPFARHGWRVWIPAAPCHLERKPAGTTSGAAFFWSTESVVLGVAQWLADIHGLIQGFRQQGVQRVGILGYSIGSLTAGLAATLWPDLDFVALLAPVGHHLQAIRHAGVAADFWPWMKEASPAESALLDRWAPINRRPVVKRLLFLMPLFDLLQPTELQIKWWEGWDRPENRRYRHGHLSICFCRRLLQDLDEYAAGL
jgi:dienelactone hydrolase